jgi:hypothetical protein
MKLSKAQSSKSKTINQKAIDIKTSLTKINLEEEEENPRKVILTLTSNKRMVHKILNTLTKVIEAEEVEVGNPSEEEAKLNMMVNMISLTKLSNREEVMEESGEVEATKL